jgi:hypothetical protein
MNLTDAELLEELERQSEESGDIPFSIEEGALIKKLSFTARSLTKETFREAWTGFLSEIGFDTLGWPVHFGIALWYQDHEMLLHAAAVFEHLHRDVRRGHDRTEEVAGYQADYFPKMLKLYAEMPTVRGSVNYSAGLRNYMRMVTLPFLNTPTDY